VGGVGLGFSKGLVSKELGQRESQSAEQADVEELAARAVAIKWNSRADRFHGSCCLRIAEKRKLRKK
jgi:hypothetical protein